LAFTTGDFYWFGSNEILYACSSANCTTPTALYGPDSTSTIMMVADATGAYWGASGTIEYCPATGCSAPKTYASPGTGLLGGGIGVDSSFVYYAAGGSVMKIAK